ncbi:MAG: hypothetical protein A2W95_01990 [Bacteroidetes bacterium GWA2_40_14]|jgi:hypothetical protein|nr:MAG: hypothetical protein A2W95_01990 [Bacteroidetes bacterium GWA2_40_14]HAZ00985.1 hypothetical protein [Marinilabiliales bacterium]
MVRLHLISFVVLFSNLFFNNLDALAATGSGDNTKWVTVTQDEGIEVQERWVTNEKNIKVRERSGKMNLNCSGEDILALISDASRTHLWMSNVESVTVIKTVSASEWYVHTKLNAPWPFGAQDMVSKYQVIRDSNQKVLKVLISPVNNLMPKQKDVERLDTFFAEWELTTTERGKVKVTFTTKSTVPPEYPSWVQDPVVRKVFFANLRNFKSILVKS